MLGATIADVLFVTVLASAGVLMTPIPVPVVVVSLLGVFAMLLVLDAGKALLFPAGGGNRGNVARPLHTPAPP